MHGRAAGLSRHFAARRWANTLRAGENDHACLREPIAGGRSSRSLRDWPIGTITLQPGFSIDVVEVQDMAVTRRNAPATCGDARAAWHHCALWFGKVAAMSPARSSWLWECAAIPDGAMFYILGRRSQDREAFSATPAQGFMRGVRRGPRAGQRACDSPPSPPTRPVP